MNSLSLRQMARRSAARGLSIFTVLDLYRQRRALARLDDHALNDIGITREDAMSEANRPIWDIFRD